MTTPKWKFLVFKNASSHTVCAALGASLLKDLQARGAELDTTTFKDIPTGVTDTDTLYLDAGGMAYVDRPAETFKVMGLTVEVPSSHVILIASALERLTLRRFEGSGISYYKLKTFVRATVLKPWQRDRLLHAMKRRIPKAEARAEAFYKTKTPLADVLKNVNAAMRRAP